ncbi:MAG: TOBE domain-containing protein [Marinobacter sp.]|nr:TOBE domain-containing protein [Marinobacter sp.]
MPDPDNTSARLTGSLLLKGQNLPGFASEQVRLLQAVEETGSIAAAARQVGISYKTAWDRIDAMNNLSAQPLVARSAGGAQGGGTQLTEFGRNVVAGFRTLETQHDKFLARLGQSLNSLDDVANFISAGTTVSSIRNQYRGVVESIQHGAVNAEVALRISDRQTLIAIITEDSLERLSLNVGAQTLALVNESSVILTAEGPLATSARNQLAGTVTRIARGAVNSDITLDLGEGKSISATITNTSLEALALDEGAPACALFKASSVILLAV